MQDLVGRGREVIASSVCFESIPDCSKEKTGGELDDCNYGRLLSRQDSVIRHTRHLAATNVFKENYIISNYIKEVISTYQLLLCNKICCSVEDGDHYKHFQFAPWYIFFLHC